MSRSVRTRRCSASSAPKPRSRNTLPVERATLTVSLMFSLDVNPNLANARTDGGHRPPIVWLKALLHAAELEPRRLSGLRRERTEFLERRSEPKQGLIGQPVARSHVSLCL